MGVRLPSSSMPPQVIFLKGVNVGGHKTFKPSELARALAHLDCVSLGAAGTLVIRKKIASAALKREVLSQLPFEPLMFICSAKEILDLIAADPFASRSAPKDVTRYVTILDKPLKSKPALPVAHPEGEQWQVKVIAHLGRFLCSWHRRSGKRLIYPNEVVEQRFQVQATTRNWNTIESVGKILGSK